MNRVELIGRMVRDPELKSTQNGTSVLSFTIAVDRRISKEKAGDGPTADFIDCVAWRQTAELIDKYVHKGDQIGIEGRIQKRDYTDKDGKKVYVTEVTVDSVDLIGGRKKDESDEYLSNMGDFEQNRGKTKPRADTIANSMDIQPDDLPFY